MEHILKSMTQLGVAAVYFVFGLIMLFLGRKVWDLITKYKSTEEIFEKDNPSAGIAEFGFLIAIALIIVGSMKDEAVKNVPIYLDLAVSLIYSIFGMIALAVAKLLLDVFTPFQLDDEISKDRNPAVGWLQAGFYIAISLIIYAVL